jgi:hypothetical protein
MWIQTYTGRKFYPLTPRAADVCLEDIAHALANTCRFSGHCRQFYSVAQHSLLVVRAVREFPGVTPDDANRIAPAALMHDAAEAYLVDMPRPIKHSWFCIQAIPGGARVCRDFKYMEHKIHAEICQRFAIPQAQDHDAAVIQVADNQLLATEARDLMAPPPEPWAVLPPPLATRIDPLPPAEAKAEFLRVAGVLGLHD